MKSKKLKQKAFSSLNLAIFIIGFAVTGGLYLYYSLAQTTTASDLNHDGQVNLIDLSILLSDYGKTGVPGDINGDGIVNIIDLSILITNYGNPVGPAEPDNCSPGTDSTELLTNTGFEGSYVNLAPNWARQSYGSPMLTFSKDASAPHSGSADQMATISAAPDSSSGVYLAQNYTFKKGQTYEASIWLKSPDNATVDFLLRRTGPYYEAGAIHHLKLTPVWTKYTIRGGWDSDVAGFFGVNFTSAGRVYIDDASLHEITGETDCVATQQAIPAGYFGMHINKWGSYNTWPTLLSFKTLRLWDTGTRWMDIEPTKGNWNWTRFDFYVNTAQKNNDDIIYTLGMTPGWASPDSLNTSAPRDINDWRTYVQTVGQRYKGRIKYWEIWNETNYGGFYTGTVDQMYQMTVAAQQVLKAIDPTNVILSPNVTWVHGNEWLDKFLQLGGGQYVDVISWHRYTTYTPELDLPLVDSIKSVMKQNGIDKPIWDTEGSTTGSPPSSDQAAGALARDYILQWSWGIFNFNWYGWDVGPGPPLSQPDYTTPTADGIAYQQIARWLTGSKLLNKHRQDDGTWIVSITESGGKSAHIVWNDSENTAFTIPTQWAVTDLKDLSGNSSAVSSGQSISVGFSPILIE